jgi:very-short-patch-repair endonuclease
MAKRGTEEWKQNIQKGVKQAWSSGQYKSVDYSKSLAQRRRLSDTKKEFYQQHPEVAREHSEKLKGKMIGSNNPNFGKKHPGLNLGKRYALGTHWPDKSKEAVKKKYRDNPELHPNRRMATLRYGQSKQQYELFLLIKETYPEAELEYPIKTNHSLRFADIAIPSKKLDIEFDGDYWHQNKQLDDLRTKHLNEIGWTVLRFGKDNFKLSLSTIKMEVQNEDTCGNQERDKQASLRG